MQNFGLLRNSPFLGGNFVCPILSAFELFSSRWAILNHQLLRRIMKGSIVVSSYSNNNSAQPDFLWFSRYCHHFNLSNLSMFSGGSCNLKCKRRARFVTYFYPWDHHSLRVFMTCLHRWRSSPTRRWTHPMWSSLMICACSNPEVNSFVNSLLIPRPQSSKKTIRKTTVKMQGVSERQDNFEIFNSWVPQWFTIFSLLAAWASGLILAAAWSK